MLASLPNVSALIEAGGEITLGALTPLPCVAVASDDSNCLAMLKRRSGESLDQLLSRLDQAIESAWEKGIMIDEINPPSSPSKPRAKRRR